LLGWSSISMASLTMRSMYRVVVARMDVLWNWMRCPKWGCVQLRLTCLDVQDVWTADAPSTWCPRNGLSAQCRPRLTHKGSCIHPVFLVLSYLWPARGNRIFLGRQAHWSDFVSGQHCANSVKYSPDIG
jgi:hypothetical protein